MVLYIVGSGRSGSTLFERTLGATRGFFNVGEMNELFRRVAPSDERCGCGEQFSQCPFWTAVGQRAFGGWDPSFVEGVAHLQRRVTRQRDLPLLLAAPRGPAAFVDALAQYQAVIARLYRAIVVESGAGVLVDASKGPALALALARSPEIDLRLVHLVRDSRGVAYSWAKTGVERPQAADGAGVMASYSPWWTAAWWTTFQTETGVVRAALSHSARVRYEDFVEDPRASIDRTLRVLNLAAYAAGLDHIDGRQVTLQPSHGLAGNPFRFRHGSVSLARDDAWRDKLPASDRRVVTAITMPGLAGYGYLRGTDIEGSPAP
jgi:hypothetical protein